MDDLHKRFSVDARVFLAPKWSGAIGLTLASATAIALVVFLYALLGLATGTATAATAFEPRRFALEGGVFPVGHALTILVTVLAGLLLLPPLTFFGKAWYLANTYPEGQAPGGRGFRYWRAYCDSVVWTLLRLLAATPLVTAGEGLFRGAAFLTQRLGWSGWVFLPAWLLAAALALLWVWVVQRWALVPYLSVRYETLGVLQLCRLSARLTRGERLRLVGARLRFLPGLAACAVFFPSLYVLPRYGQTMAIYARWLLERADTLPEGDRVRLGLAAPPLAGKPDPNPGEAEHGLEPASESPAKPVAEPVAEPAAEPPAEPVAGPDGEPDTEPGENAEPAR